MDRKTFSQQVTAIIPCFNEAERIARVLKVLSNYNGFAEIIVVDDGSTDNTKNIVKQFPVTFLQHAKNKGKAQTMETGVQAANTNIICFFDADIVGLTHEMVDNMIAPVVNGEVDMFIAMRNRKIYALQFILNFVPLLGGERTLTKELWEMIPEYYKHKFRIEAGLNFFANYYGNGYRFDVFPKLSQTIKEKKYGLWDGFKRRILMFDDIIRAQWKLQTIDVPLPLKNQRKVAAKLLPIAITMLVGILFLVAAWYGPTAFLLKLFKNDLQTEVHTPVINGLIELSTVLGTQVIAIIASLLIAFNIYMGARYISQYLRLREEHSRN